jgi:Protein of unknown function (DUF3592)
MWRNKMKNFLFSIWILAGVALFAGAGKLFVENYRFKAHAVVLEGEVIASKPGQQKTGMPTVRYVTSSGEQREHKYNAPLAGSEFQVGEKVNVLYDPESSATKLDDWSELYLFSSLVGFIAFLILLPPLAAGVIYLYVWWPGRNNGQISKRKA